MRSIEKARHESRSLEAQAAELFLSIQQPTAGLEDWQAYRAWRQQSAQHRLALERLERLWSDLDTVDELPWPSERELQQDRDAGDAPLQTPGKRRARMSRSFGRARLPYTSGPLVRALAYAAGLLAVMIVAVLQVWPPGGAPGKVYRTAVAEHRTVKLEDGSHLVLGGRSTVRVSYSARERRVIFGSGEALFSVAKDPGRPFVVESGGFRMEALGTEFDVRQNLDEVMIAVVEGRVRVVPPKAERTASRSAHLAERTSQEADIASATPLVAGQQAVYDRVSGTTQVRTTGVADVMSWRHGILSFSNEPLRNVLANINRYASNSIVIEDDEIGSMLYTGTALRDDIDNWLRGLEMAFPVKILRTADDRILIRRRVKG
jgi:transmembrane sensor